jgi:large subunit ribosomal protein L22
MTGPKLNEKNFVAGERSGTRASAKYVRSSARKARVVLDLVRDLDVTRADQVLQFTDREIARTIRKVLASAVANAVNNDGQDAEELYIKACFADEGPTLRRFRPRARGRATRIRKRTCHITIIVDRMSEQQLNVLAAKAQRGGGRGAAGGGAASRRARVEASRQRAAVRKRGGEAVEETPVDTEVTETEVVETEAIETTETVETETVETTEAAADEAVETEAVETTEADETAADETADDAGDAEEKN